MFFDFDSYTYYLRPGATDSRKSWLSLSSLVDEQMKLNHRSKSMFLFCNKARNSIKILVWDNGYWIMHKRLEKGTFAWPNTQEEARLVSLDDIKRVLRGENIFRQHLSYIFDKRAKGCRLCLYSSLCPTSFWVYKEEKFKQDWFNFYGDYDNSIEYILKESK